MENSKKKDEVYKTIKIEVDSFDNIEEKLSNQLQGKFSCPMPGLGAATS